MRHWAAFLGLSDFDEEICTEKISFVSSVWEVEPPLPTANFSEDLTVHRNKGIENVSGFEQN